MASNEIEGARRLLNLAQKWNRAAAEFLARARSNDSGAIVELAQVQVTNSARDVAEAAGYLKEVERRWEIIDIESDAEASPTKTESVAADEDSSAAEDGFEIAPSTDHSQPRSSISSDVVVLTARTEESASKDGSIPYHVTVKGCGTTKANGTYTITGYHAGAPKYSKTTNYHGSSYMTLLQEETDERERRWLLVESTLGNGIRTKFAYYQHATSTNDSSNLPPRFKWKRVTADFCSKDRTRYRSCSVRLPAGKISYESIVSSDSQYEELAVVGCGTEDARGQKTEHVNGIYKAQSMRMGGPSYFKVCAPDGIPRVNLYRMPSHPAGYCFWFISVLQQDRWLDYYLTYGAGELPLTCRDFTWRNVSHRGSPMIPNISLKSEAPKSVPASTSATDTVPWHEKEDVRERARAAAGYTAPTSMNCQNKRARRG